MRILKLRRLAVAALFSVAFASTAWCARMDQNGSNYGVNTVACGAGNAPQAATAFGSITATCFAPGSDPSDPTTLFELKNNTSPFPSSIDVTVTFLSPASAQYGLLLCDGSASTVPCVFKDSSLGTVNPVNFSNVSFSGNSAIFTFTNFTGELPFYVNEAASLTNIAAAAVTAVPEPRTAAIAALGLLILLTATRPSKLRPQSLSFLRNK